MQDSFSSSLHSSTNNMSKKYPAQSALELILAASETGSEGEESS